MTQQPDVQLESLGSFFVDDNGKINFKPEELPAAFSQPVFAERVIHPDAEHQILVGDKETTNTVMTELLAAKSRNKRPLVDLGHCFGCYWYCCYSYLFYSI